ncbi:MAG: hypothetical protein IJO63_00510 [Bacilli bacterium]|nr:hypothetical protein [Bacilli bacterium]
MLNSLEVVNGSMSPSFKENIFEYTVNVSDEALALVLNCKAEDGATITVYGNDYLTPGENHVIIEVYKEALVTYTLTVLKNESDEVANMVGLYDKVEVNANSPWYKDYITPIIGITCFLTIISLFCIIFKKK